MLTMSKEHTERIIKMKTRLEYMTIDAEQQKNEILEHKHKERERLDKIAEVILTGVQRGTRSSNCLDSFKR